MANEMAQDARLAYHYLVNAESNIANAQIHLRNNPSATEETAMLTDLLNHIAAVQDAIRNVERRERKEEKKA